jgi:hypothetical protein
VGVVGRATAEASAAAMTIGDAAGFASTDCSEMAEECDEASDRRCTGSAATEGREAGAVVASATALVRWAVAAGVDLAGAAVAGTVGAALAVEVVTTVVEMETTTPGVAGAATVEVVTAEAADGVAGAADVFSAEPCVTVEDWLAGESVVLGLEGQANVTSAATVGAGASGALIAGAGSESSDESGRAGPGLAAGRTLSDGAAAEAQRTVTNRACSITAGGQRGRVNVRWSRADVPCGALRFRDDPPLRRYRVFTTTRGAVSVAQFCERTDGAPEAVLEAGAVLEGGRHQPCLPGRVRPRTEGPRRNLSSVALMGVPHTARIGCMSTNSPDTTLLRVVPDMVRLPQRACS